MSVMEINRDNFQEEVVRSDRPVLLDFWAPWCGPCRMVAPILEEIARENPDIKVGKINVDREQELAARFRVVSIPSLFVLEGGEILEKAIGARPKEQILALIR